MASTNTNTGSDQSILSTDIYEISDFIDQIRKDNVPNVSDTASMVGIFGYMNEIFSQTIQNTLIAVSETSNETIPTKAKFSKNIITHALNLGITDINSKPSVMTMMIYMPLDYLEKNFSEIDTITGKAKFILDKNVPIFVDKYEFHLDYDIIFTRVKNPSGNYIYTAMYDLFETGTTTIKQLNPISNITNPYITTLVKYTIDDVEYLAFSAKLHQVSLITIDKNILTNNSIENKVVTFDFDNQLASFDVDVIENNITTHLTPIFSGLLDYTIEDKWCYYDYIDENTIRIIFDRDSYVPGMNSVVRINVKISEGSAGNFTYNQNFRTSMKSERFNNYNGMYLLVYPLLNGIASGGKDKKSISDLKKIIPREASSRGAIINTTDLNNFFNSINDNKCKLYFMKKRDNPFERLYYSYMVMRKNAIVYPTNTLDLSIEQSDFKGYAGNNNLIILPGTIFYYHRDDYIENNYASVNKPKDIFTDEEHDYEMVNDSKGNRVRLFEYISPFLISIDDDLITSYLLTVMNNTKTFKFSSINTNSNVQFVATNMNWSRKFIYNDEYGKTHVYDNKYTMDVSITQNNNTDYGLIKYHMNGNNEMVFDDVRVKMIMVLYADDTDAHPYRYIEAQLIRYTKSNFVYDFRFTLESDDLMDLTNRINIKNIYNAKPEEIQHKDIVNSYSIGKNIKYLNVYSENDDKSDIVGTIEDLETTILITKYNNNYGYIETPYAGWVKLSELENKSHGYMNKNTYAKIFILSDFGTKTGDNVNGKIITEDEAEVILYQDKGDEVSNPGNRNEIEAIVPTIDDIIDKLFNNEIYVDVDGERLTIVSIIKNSEAYMAKVYEYNNDTQNTEAAILRYIRNNKDTEYVQNVILQDEDVQKIINAYNYEDLSRYTLCNVLSVDNGIDFYYDYSSIMTSNVIVEQIQETDKDGNLLFKTIKRTDSIGNNYNEYMPIYKMNESGTHYYNYKVKRIPMIKNGFLNTESKMQDFIYDLEERRKYMNECLSVLEDTFSVDLKFFNTFGPSRLFYYNVPSAKSFDAVVSIKIINVYSNIEDEDNEDNIVGALLFGQDVHIVKTRGQWGYIEAPYTGWINLSTITRKVNYIDNTALTMKFAIEAQTSADKYITNNIVFDIKEFIEDINEITELHVPNIITLITNNYREQLIYFEFLDVNNYGVACQHLYLQDTDNADICPELLNIETDDFTGQPKIDIAVY